MSNLAENEATAGECDRVRADKVVLTRESRGLTQGELADAMSVAQATVSKIESDLMIASPELLARMSKALHYPPSVFTATDQVLGGGPTDLYHRKRQSTAARLMKRIYASVNLRRMQIARLLRALDFQCAFPRYPIGEDFAGEHQLESPEDIARAVRATWHLPAGPIENLTEIVESFGGIIVPMDFGTRLVDAISHWFPPVPPLFFMNRNLARSRYRMTLAHELGHLVMHFAPNLDMEDQANRFAAEFLMPARDIKRQLQSVSLPRLADLKLHWRVSMAALLKRASDLKMISSVAATKLWRQLSHRGYRKAEPLEGDLPWERPSVLGAMVKTHLEDLSHSSDQLASLVGLFADEFRELFMPDTGPLRLVPSIR